MASFATSAILTRIRRTIGPWLATERTGALVARLYNDRIPHRGLVIDTSSPLVSNTLKASLFLNGYESGEYRFVRKYLPRDGDVIELGGSLGVISATIRRRIAPAQRLVIVEADPRLAVALQRNLALNNAAANTHVEQCAISYDGAATVEFSLGESSVSGRLDSDTALQKVSVPAITLGQLAARHGFSRFSLVCDIEGAEWQIFEHDLAALGAVDWLVIEMHAVAGLETAEAQIARIEATGLFHLVDQHGNVAVFRGGVAQAGAH